MLKPLMRAEAWLPVVAIALLAAALAWTWADSRLAAEQNNALLYSNNRLSGRVQALSLERDTLEQRVSDLVQENESLANGLREQLPPNVHAYVTAGSGEVIQTFEVPFYEGLSCTDTPDEQQRLTVRSKFGITIERTIAIAVTQGHVGTLGSAGRAQDTLREQALQYETAYYLWLKERVARLCDQSAASAMDPGAPPTPSPSATPTGRPRASLGGGNSRGTSSLAPRLFCIALRLRRRFE